jgi:hypothetical protein
MKTIRRKLSSTRIKNAIIKNYLKNIYFFEFLTFSGQMSMKGKSLSNNEEKHIEAE